MRLFEFIFEDSTAKFRGETQWRQLSTDSAHPLLNCISPTRKITPVHALKKISTRAIGHYQSGTYRTTFVQVRRVGKDFQALTRAFMNNPGLVVSRVLEIMAIMAFMAILTMCAVGL